MLGLLVSGSLLGATIAVGVPATQAFTQNPAPVFINEIHYDNASTDVGEAIEIAGPAGTDLTGWKLVRYNGNTPTAATVYTSPAASETLSGTIPNNSNGYGFVVVNYPVDGLQNGGNDGVALVNASNQVVQFLSYEGVATASNGPAAGLTSTDIDVSETGTTPAGFSLQLSGSGSTYQDFTWSAPADDSFGAVNAGQTFVGVNPSPSPSASPSPNPSPSPTPPPVNPCEQLATPISQVQGAGAATPLAGQTVSIQGIVVGDFQENDGDQFNTDLDGFYVQEEQVDHDADPLTSEGIFVFARTAANVVPGDVVRVTGQAAEFNSLTQINASNGTVVDCGDAALPDPTDLTLPVDSIADFERFEGMYVEFPQQLRISEYFNFDRFGEIALCQPNPADPADEQDRLYQPTAIDEPYSPGAEARAEYNDEACITVDDARSEQNPDPARHPNGEEFTLDNRFRGGDIVQNTTGVLDFRFSLYRVQPTEGADYTATNPRPAAPEAVGGDLKIASFNVLNYFNGDGMGGGFPTPRGASDPNEFQRQQAKIVAALTTIDADIFGLIEIENDPAGENSAIDDLVDALNAAIGSETYSYIETGVIGTDEIKVGIVYKPGSVTPVGAFDVLTTADDPRFRDDRNRPALAQTFEDNDGGRFTVVVNHFKSKGSGCGAGDDDPVQGNCNGTRTQAAEALVDWIATDPTGSNDPDFLIVGDLNAYDKEDPIDEIRAGADDVLGTADDYTDLEFAFNGEFAYSYLFDAQFGYLDYAMAIQSLVPQITGTTTWHINADEPDILDYDTSFKPDAQDVGLYEPTPFRSSDHDPVIVGLNLTIPNRAPVAVDDSYSVNEDTTLTVPARGVLGNDSDADNNALVAELVSGPANGTLTLNADGSFSYTPNANFNGSDSFGYRCR
jgi:uncharacterized protein